MQELSHKARAFLDCLVRPGCSLRRLLPVSLGQQTFSVDYHHDQRQTKAIEPFWQVGSTQGSSLHVEPRLDQPGNKLHLVAHYRS